jgi:DNA-directed RNA polymerase subunit alpha
MSFRVRAFTKLDPYLKKAQKMIVANDKTIISSAEFSQDKKIIALENTKSSPSIKLSVNPHSDYDDQFGSENVEIKDLELKEREYNCLNGEGILDLKELVKKTESDLLRIPNFGKGSLSHVNKVLQERGLILGFPLQVEEDNEGSQRLIPRSVRNMKIIDMDLSVREKNCFAAEGICDLKTLIQNTPFSLLKIPNFGNKSLRLVIEALRDRGLYLGMNSSFVTWVDSGSHSLAPRSVMNIKVEDMDLTVREGNCFVSEDIYDLKTLVAKKMQTLCESLTLVKSL